MNCSIQQVVDEIGVHLHSWESHALKRRGPRVGNAGRRRAKQDNLVAEQFG